MTYYLSRGGQQYGPYTMDQLRAMSAQGQLLPGDLVYNEGRWMPAADLVRGGGSVQPPQSGQPAPLSQGPPMQQPQGGAGMYAQPQTAGGAPPPPGLHWALVLLLAMVTCGIFGIVWMFMQASYAKKIDPENKSTKWFIIYLATFAGFYIVAMILNLVVVAGLSASASQGGEPSVGAVVPLMIVGVLSFAGYGFAIFAALKGIFGIRRSLLNYFNSVEPINLRLSGVMTFFFNIYYFQYHFQRIADWKRTGVLRPQG